MSATLHQDSTTATKTADIVVEVEQLSPDNEQAVLSTPKNGETCNAPATVMVLEEKTKIENLDKEAKTALSSQTVTPTTSSQPTVVGVFPCLDTDKRSSSTPALVPEPHSVNPTQSAWARFRENIAHDPLNEPEFVNAYNDWKKRNRKERYERRRAWITAHGYKLGKVLRLVDKERSKEAWAAYQKKLAYMED
ncbi:hypothetical protein QFC20_007444 [Naganishia adeliensis]|uniref:Uncharacterized protein n=1 Tax=Naganishia adeliensis TaxID=92952 RepID=A0ACC2V0D4_9TREE|nr:hypothetical protein QFC20_007444 [Naganishia adeliensis]